LATLANKQSKLKTASATAACALLLSACAAGPDFQRPAAPVAGGYGPQSAPAATTSVEVAQGEAQRFESKKDVPFDWWTLFQSPQLNSLIGRAFKANPSIESAQAALRQAQQYTIAQQGYFYPTVSATYTPSRNKLAGNMGGNSPGVQGNGTIIQTYSNPAGPRYNGPAYYNFHTAQLSIGYVPDIFGSNRRQVESLRAQEEMQRFQLEATYIALASNVVAAALQEASLRAQIAAQTKIVELNRSNLDILEKQLKLGAASRMDVLAQEAALAQAEQSIIPLQNQLEQTRDLIRALAGNLPNEDVAETFELSSLHLPQELPLTLPSQLVEQRPDVRAAEAQFHAATANVGVAVAARLPQFEITAAIGGMASTPDWMFKTGGGFFTVLGNLSQTLFDGGTLKAQERAAREALVQAGADYRSTVIVAFQNVADTLHTIQSDAEALKAAAKTEEAMKRVADIARKQHDAGYTSYQTVLMTEQNHQQATINLIQAQTNRLGDTAALYQALGGGWWNRNENQVTHEQ
jgi:NodT family efflux transporter outer membrane factor (OMF) lipoprotein